MGVVALVGLVAFRAPPMPGWFKGLSLLGAAAVSGLMVQAANLGGKIAHEELRGSVPASAGSEGGHEGEAGEESEGAAEEAGEEGEGG